MCGQTTPSTRQGADECEVTKDIHNSREIQATLESEEDSRTAFRADGIDELRGRSLGGCAIDYDHLIPGNVIVLVVSRTAWRLLCHPGWTLKAPAGISA